MGLFDFFNQQNQSRTENQTFTPQVPKEEENRPADIPKELFIEERTPQSDSPIIIPNQQVGSGIEAIYNFLQADYETKGFNDALTNPDESYRTDNIKLISLDLYILIQKVNTYYEDMIREIDFHISTRSRAGLIDLVEELKAKKEMVYEHVAKVAGIKKEMDTGSGMNQRIILSYQRGFMRGLSALTQSNVLNKKL